MNNRTKMKSKALIKGGVGDVRNNYNGSPSRFFGILCEWSKRAMRIGIDSTKGGRRYNADMRKST